MKEEEEAQVRVAELEARVRALEEALEQRSRDLREIQRRVGPRDLLEISRILDGLPLEGCHGTQIRDWRETTDLVQMDVEESLTALWTSIQRP